MLRRLHPDQPDSFAFTPANQAWAEAQITKYPEGRQASAIIPLLWRAQEQEGWLSRPAIEAVANMLDLAYIRALEVATFYFMFQLQPVGSVAHIQICGTLSCMICGAEDLIEVCREKIAKRPHEVSADGKFSWEEVECLGSCANAPMAQIGKDYYEDLTADGFGELIDRMAAGEVPVPGPQNGRYAAEPLSGLTSLTEYAEGRPEHNASVALAVDIGDTLKRIDGTEVPLVTPWQQGGGAGETPPAETTKGSSAAQPAAKTREDGPTKPAEGAPADDTGVTVQEATAQSDAKPPSKEDPEPGASGTGSEGTVADGAGAGGNEARPDHEPLDDTNLKTVKPTEDLPGQDGDQAVPPRDAADDAATGDEAGASLSERAAPTDGTPEITTKTGPGPSDMTKDASAADVPESEPELLDGPRAGGADDLKRISGVGPKLEGVLNDLGFWHFDQIAKWGPQEIAWVDARLKFKGRIERDDWVSQAKAFAAES